MKKFITYFITIFFLASSLGSTAYALEKDSVGPFCFELTAVPFGLNGELYLSLIDSMKLFNLEVIRDYNIIKNKKIGPDYGNIINGMNIVTIHSQLKI